MFDQAGTGRTRRTASLAAAAALALVAAGCGGGDATDELAAELCETGERMFDVLESGDLESNQEEMIAVGEEMQRIIDDAEEQGVSEADLTARAEETCPELEERGNELMDLGDGAGDLDAEPSGETDEG